MAWRENPKSRFDPVEQGSDAFGEHTRAMRSFRQYHQSSAISLRETGGTRRNVNAAWSLLIYRIAPEQFSRN